MPDHSSPQESGPEIVPVSLPGSVGLPMPELGIIRDNWGWFLALGLIQVLVGATAITMAALATLASVIVIGLLALISGGAELASAIWARGWSGTLQHILCGVLYLVFGLIVTTRPVQSAEMLTLVLAMMFLVGGAIRIGLAVSGRFHQWGYVLFSGIITLLMGGMILSGWPGTSFWVIGTFVGIELLFAGWMWVMLAFALKKLPSNKISS